jgi:hypothetical protein
MSWIEFAGLGTVAACILVLLVVYAGMMFGGDRR